SVSVLGLRRAGKTSFLQYVAHKDVMARYLPDPENYAMVYVDMSSCKNPSDFYRRLLIRLQVVLGQGQRVNLWKESSSGATKMYDIEALLCQYPERRIALLLDEFDHLKTGAFDQDFLTELRAMTGVMDYELACVTASYWDLYQLGSHIGLPPTSPFYNIFYPTPIYLSGLETAAAQELVRKPAERAGWDATAVDITKIRQLAGSLPFFIQATAAKWFQDKREYGRVSPTSVASHLIAVMSPYFAQWWRSFTACERDLLVSLAHKEPVSQLSRSDLEITEAARRLRHYGLLKRRGDSYRINGSIAAYWIRFYAGKIVLGGRNRVIQSRETIDPVALRHALVNYFDMEELRTLCFDLGVDFDELKGEGKGAKSRDLVAYWQHHGDLTPLVEAIRRERGDVINLPVAAL
ncbi:MAG: AAA family ATPase, partial [Chloroflexi bacterium]|nr:AAA family ATPase [Chloroflexota bacterium]